MDRAKAVLIAFVAIFFIASCGGGSDSEEAVEALSATILADDSIYSISEQFYPSQAVFVTRSEGFENGRSYSATDGEGRSITITGRGDGSAVLVLPSTLPTGVYSVLLDSDRLDINVIQPTIPLDPDVYVRQIGDELLLSLQDQIAELSLADAARLQGLYTIIETELGNLLQSDPALVEQVANIFYANGFRNLDANSSSLFNSAFARDSVFLGSSVVRASNFNASECRNAKLRFLLDVGITAGFTALASGTGPAVILFLGVATTLALDAASSAEEVVKACPGNVSSALISEALGLSASHSARLAYEQNNTSFAVAAAVVEQKVTFVDGKSSDLKITAEVGPEYEVESVLTKIESGLVTISVNAPESLKGSIDDALSAVRSLLTTKTLDITSQSQILPFRSSEIICSGPLIDHTCSFLGEEDQIFDQSLNFTLSIDTQDYGQLTATAELNPRGLPVVLDQTFTVIAGEPNRLLIEAKQDPDSSDYELEKVTDFELLTHPAYGVVLNEFNQLGVLDYAIDISDTMPEEVTFTVRAKNRYGFSEPATIRLEIVDVQEAQISSCLDILQFGESVGDGVYPIDKDGEGPSLPYEVYCDMTLKGGGWTLVANHADDISVVSALDTVYPSAFGVLTDDTWNEVRNNMQVGMMFVDEHGNTTLISADKLRSGNCRSINSVSSLEQLANAGSGFLWHSEYNSETEPEKNCDGGGLNYSLITLAGSNYGNYDIAGASLTNQGPLKFDEWPEDEYRSREFNGFFDRASYEDQDNLRYYLK